jgi:hypothetical protein
MIPADGSVTSTKLANDISISGTLGVTGNIIGSGTANRLVNQLASNSADIMTKGLVDTDCVNGVKISLSIYESFMGGGTTSGTIGSLGWITGAASNLVYGRVGPYVVLGRAAAITAALDCSVLSLFAGDYTGAGGIYSKTTTKTFKMVLRAGVGTFATSGKPPSWGFYFGANTSAGVLPNAIIPANSYGIAAIDPADRTWAASTAYVVGDTLSPVTPNGFKYICTTAGTSAGSEPTWPTTFKGTVTNGGAVFTNAGIAGNAKFIFYITGADPLVNITTLNSTIDIPTTSANVWYDLIIESTATAIKFSVNGETPLEIANASSLMGSFGICCRNDASQTFSTSLIKLEQFGFYGSDRRS